MSKQIFLIILASVSGLVFLGLGEQAAAMVSDAGLLEKQNYVGSACATSSPERSSECLEMEQKILDATLRIEIRTWIIYVEGKGYVNLSGNGHGTVMGGRYLVTHNHFQLPLQDLLADEQASQSATVTLYTVDGKQLWQGPLTVVSVASQDSESLVFEFRNQDGRGFFEWLGASSADFDVLEQTSIRPGTEVAQINWDSNQAYVQWTRVEDITEEGGTPVVRLSDCIVLGSSGGGIFVDGTHIANNWSRAFACNGSTDGNMQFGSTAALNSASLLAVAQR